MTTTADTSARVTTAAVRELCACWQPRTTPHCSDCRHAVVGGQPSEPTVRCARGHGGPVPLWRLIRLVRPLGFRPAAACPDFDSMAGPP